VAVISCACVRVRPASVPKNERLHLLGGGTERRNEFGSGFLGRSAKVEHLRRERADLPDGKEAEHGRAGFLGNADQAVELALNAG
jgi:hypothetical protein